MMLRYLWKFVKKKYMIDIYYSSYIWGWIFGPCSRLLRSVRNLDFASKTSKSEFYFRECPNNRTRRTELPLACYTESRQPAYTSSQSLETLQNTRHWLKRLYRRIMGTMKFWPEWHGVQPACLNSLVLAILRQMKYVLYFMSYIILIFVIVFTCHHIFWNSDVCFDRPVVSILSLTFL